MNLYPNQQFNNNSNNQITEPEKREKSPLSNFKELFNKNFNKEKTIQALKYIGILLLILPILFILIASSYILDLKQSYQYAIAGKNDLEASLGLASHLDFKNTIEQANQANHNLTLSINKIEKVENGVLASYFPYFKSQINSINHLISSGKLVTDAVIESTEFAQEIQIILNNHNADNLLELSSSTKAQILDATIKSENRFKGIQEKIADANTSLKNVQTTGILWPIKDKVQTLKDKLSEAQVLINKTVPMTKIGPTLVGYPEKARYLVLLQNSDRLRPIGGTVGTYAIVEIEKGEIIKYDLYDSHYLDELSNSKITPPENLKELIKTDDWSFIDANWSPDWTMNAKQAEWLYRTKLLSILKNKKTDKCPIADCNLNFDGVIGITPELTLDLLAVTGSVTINNTEYSKNNFTRLYESELDKKYEKAGRHYNEKLLISEITKALHLKLFTLPFSSWPELGSVLTKNADSKNILIYSKDKELENLLIAQGWGGELKSVVGDYLMITDTNIPASRLNINVDQFVNYEVTQENNKLIGNLTVKYNYLKNNESRNYKNYVRIFTPLGTKLINSSVGLNNTNITNELGKTSFGAQFEIRPGTSYELKLTYELPSLINSLANIEKYSIYIQKQPGNNIKELEVFTHLKNNITEIKGNAFYSQKLSDNKVNWKTDLLTDKQFEAITTK